MSNVYTELAAARKRIAELEAQAATLTTLFPESEWHEDYGDVLWHRLDEYGRLCEAPIVAHPLSSNWVEEDMAEYTHWSLLPLVEQPSAPRPGVGEGE
jgi:hypothetical protein